MYKNILFDFDGTIADTSIGIINAARYTLKKLNIDFSNINLNDFIGSPLQDSFKNFCGIDEKDIPQAIQIFREYYKECGLYESELYIGIEETLRKLQSCGCNLFIASSKPSKFIEELLKKYNIKNYFKFISGSPVEGECYTKYKVISTVIKTFNLVLDETIMIGDRKYDIIGAKENKIKSIGAEYGLGTLEELKSCEPDYIIKNPQELIEIIL